MEHETEQRLQGEIETLKREKDWLELDINEKVERMREIIKGQSTFISQLQSKMHHIRNSFYKHSHSNDKIMVPCSENNNGCNIGIAKLRNDNYF